MTRTAFITGVTGFVGSHLAELLLAEGCRVVGLARDGTWIPGSEHLEERVDLRKAELTDDEALAAALRDFQPDDVYHLAGLASVPVSIREPQTAWRVNFLGSQALYSAVETHAPAARVLVVSSGTVYGKPAPDQLPITEQTRLNPATPYAQSKLAAELLALRLSHERGLHCIVARAFNHIGPRQQGEFAIAEFARQIARIEQTDEPPVLRCGRLDVERDFTDVRDIVRAYRGLVQSAGPGEVYNIASGKSRRLQDMLNYLLKLSHRLITVATEPSLLRAEDPALLRVDVSALVRCTGWKPAYSLDETLRDTLDHCRRTVETEFAGLRRP
jgi:GDP-4-dehydro-6-deoxy-D-mannose reductase